MPFLIPSYTANAYILQQFSLTPGSQTLELVNPYLAISALDVGQRIGFSWLDEVRSEEHTSELQSHVRISYAVFCLKKKNKKKKKKKQK